MYQVTKLDIGSKSVSIVVGTYHALLGLDEGSVLSVHLVVEAAGVAQVVTVAVASPQRRRSSAAVDAFTAL